METMIKKTASICSSCLNIIPAIIVEENGKIFMIKECHAHGMQKVAISNDAGWYHRMMRFAPVLKSPPAKMKKPTGRGCPYDCGYCMAHTQKMYLPVVPITSACNLNCPVCYTINKNQNAYFMSKEEFARTLDSIHTLDPDMQIINFTGGEPTMHPEFCDLVEMCKKAGIHRITISTNGLKFLEDDEMLARLTELDSRIVLSFNSFRSAPYEITAGKDLLETKLEILQKLEKYRPVTTLLTVVALGINEKEIGEIVRYILKSDFIVSSEIHTVTFTGQSSGRFDASTRLTPFDVISDIVEKNKFLRFEDFLPSPCAHPLCYTTCYLLQLQDGTVVPFTQFMDEDSIVRMLSGSLYMEPNMKTEEIFSDALNNLWAKESPGERDKEILATLKRLIQSIFAQDGRTYGEKQKIAEQSTKAIYLHSHMDADNFDTERMSQCCVAVPESNGCYIPTCSYNNIYRARDARFSS